MPWIDVAKGIAITLVVYGHVMQGAIRRGFVQDLRISEFSLALVYSFHMPAFFFISGLFIAASLERSPAEFLKNRVRTLLWPYVLWCVIGTFSALTFGRFYSNPSSEPLRALTRIFWDTGGFWFLYVLFLTQLVAFGFRKIPSYLPLLGSMLLYLSGFQFKLEVCNKVIAFFPFLSGGVCAGPFIDRISNIPRRIAVTAFALLGILQCSLVLSGVQTISFVSLLLGFSGTLWIFSAAFLLATTRAGRSFLPLGAASLVVFLLHPYFQGATRELLLRILHCHLGWIHVLVQTAVAVYSSTVIWKLSEKYGFWFLFTLKRSAHPATAVI